MAKRKHVMTVGELIAELQKHHPDLPVHIPIYREVLTAAGTDLGGDEDHRIEGVYNLDQGRIVLQPDRIR